MQRRLFPGHNLPIVPEKWWINRIGHARNSQQLRALPLLRLQRHLDEGGTGTTNRLTHGVMEGGRMLRTHARDPEGTSQRHIVRRNQIGRNIAARKAAALVVLY